MTVLSKKFWLALLVFNALFGAACGELNLGDGSAAGGAGGSGGGGSAGDDGAPTPPAGRAAVSLHLDKVPPGDPIHGTSDCAPGQHWMNIPYQRDRPTADQTQQTTEMDAPVIAVAGQSGDRLSCRVTPRGTAFTVTAEVNGYAEYDGQKLRPTVAQIAITAISADQPDALGSVTITDDASLKEYTDDGCRFSTQGGSLGVEAGRIWAKVQCDYLEPRGSTDQACRLDTGVFLLENCSQ
jgi:hypothetical protein